MKQDNDIDKLLRDAAENFELPYEDQHWQKFQQLQKEQHSASGGTQGASGLFFNRAKWGLLALIVVSFAGIYWFVNKKSSQQTEEQIAVDAYTTVANPTTKAAEKPPEEAVAIIEKPKPENTVAESPAIAVKPAIVINAVKSTSNNIVNKKHVVRRKASPKARVEPKQNQQDIYVFPQAGGQEISIDNNQSSNNASVSNNATVNVQADTLSSAVKMQSEGISIADTIFERNLTSTAFVEKTSAAEEKKDLLKSVPANEQTINTFAGKGFSLDVVTGAAFYKSLQASTTNGSAISNNTTYAVDLFIGVRVEYTLSDKLSLFTQPVYQQRSHIQSAASATQTSYEFGKNQNDFTLSVNKLHYIEVPLGVGIKLYKTHKLYAGIGLAYLGSTTATVKEFDAAETKVQSGYKNGFNTVDYYTLVAYQYELMRRLRLFAQWQYAPTSAIDKKYYTTSSNASNTTVKIGVSINLYDNKK